ncbi:Helicase associated domain protein [Streptomyces sp. NPDC056161]|uniref:DEAD/DEAH box helicase n=1 Tax=Streptomyces sp. NPDC056161 TaxID=3345732 RepID=UPI0035E1A443
MQLRPHQREALDAIEAGARAGLRRMTVVSASGSGKTLIAQRAAESVAPTGATVVLVPTKALVVQTALKWREAGYRGLLFGLCSLSQHDSGIPWQTVRMTSDPGTILPAVQQRRGAATVIVTYASLRHLTDARALGAIRWDLLIADEAHRTCAGFADGWGAVHDDTLIRATTRLYMTATPRIWAARTGTAQDTGRVPLATMEHQEVFGPIVYRLGLADAIARGIVADYQVLVVTVDDTDRDLLAILNDAHPAGSAHLDGLRNAAVQVALLRAVAEHRLRRILAFHNRVEAADGFARTLPTTAAKVHEPLRRTQLWSHAVTGEQDDTLNQSLLAAFDDPAHDVAVLSNARLLNEGVDLPDLDGVVFAAPRYSTIDAVQGVSRGLRQPPGAGKRTTLIVPVYLPRTGEGADILENSDFAALIAILEALRSHDESFMDRVTLPEPTRTNTVITRELLYAEPERAAQLARVLGLKILIPAAGTWRDGLRAATAHHRVHGNLTITLDYTDEQGFGLGQWIANQRLHHLLGTLPADCQAALEDLGMSWQLPSPTQAMLDHARLYMRIHGHLLAAPDTVVGGYALGRWLANCRSRAGAGTLDADVQSALDRIDRWWNPAWPPAWQRAYAHAKALYPGPGQLWHLASRPLSPQDRQALHWIEKQERDFFKALTPEQQDLLVQIGASPCTEAPLRPVRASGRQTPDRRGDGLAYAARFLAEHGHMDIPVEHMVTWKGSNRGPAGSFPLGTWFQEQRAGLAALPADERRALNALVELARRAAQPGHDQALATPAVSQLRARCGAAATDGEPQDAIADLTGRPHALPALYRKARISKNPFVCIERLADGWSARVDTSTTKLVLVRPEVAHPLQYAIEDAIGTGEAAWGSFGPVHFGLGGLPDEDTARRWAARLYQQTRDHLRDPIGYYGFSSR